MISSDSGTVKIFRYDPALDSQPRYETYEIPFEVWHNRKVMQVIKYIYENLAPGLAFRESCYQSLCGCCTVRVNNKPVLACEAMAEKEMLIEPINPRKVLKDLVAG
jgi:succinate dehydrogenase/fumarate reductase-like Fe-S protein